MCKDFRKVGVYTDLQYMTAYTIFGSKLRSLSPKMV